MSESGIGNCLFQFDLPAGVCQSTNINSTLGSSRLLVDVDCDLRYCLPLPLPAYYRRLLFCWEQHGKKCVQASAALWLTGANPTLLVA